MDEQASFETRAVLPPRRGNRARLALLLPAVAIVVIAWAGASSTRSDETTADRSHPATTSTASQSAAAATAGVARASSPPQPAEVVGLGVQALDAIRPLELGRDDVIAVAGWYRTTAITDCPPLAAIYRKGALPEVRGDADEWAFCVRSGVLYASRPDPEELLATDELDGNGFRSAGLEAVRFTVVVGVVVPPELEVIGADPIEVVVVGRLVESGGGCGAHPGCRRELLVDHVAWTGGA